MVSGIFHSGSGVGNQLHRYVATRVLAMEKGYDFTMIAPENNKMRDFMDLDLGVKLDIKIGYSTDSAGKVSGSSIGLAANGFKSIFPWEEKTSYFNPEFFFIKDNTIIDGEFQSEQYFGHRMEEIDEWLEVKPVNVLDDTCVIGFRGGEFYLFPELGLPASYFEEGIKIMREINPEMEFEVHTDDPKLATQFFPDFEVIHDVGYNWRSIRFAKYAIIANSSFYILPRLLKHYKDEESLTIAPRYWARHNTKEWSRPDNFYRCFTYL